MTLLQWTFDILLSLGLLSVAWQTLASSDLFKAIVSFVAFGLLMALAWVRLNAPDIAIAEAAVGAGLTGALLLAALARLRSMTANEDVAAQSTESQPDVNLLRWLPLAALVAVAAGLAYVVSFLPSDAPGLGEQVAANLETSGVRNPVTAVLLNFRGYDTLLEVFVLLLALLGCWSLGGSIHRGDQAPGPVLSTLSSLLVPVLLLVASYLLWVGADGPGGAFQAGSVLGAAGILLRLAGGQAGFVFPGWLLRPALVAGPGAFVVVAVVTRLTEGQFLEYPPKYAGPLILFLEATAAISIGVTLAALFLLGAPAQERKPV